MPLLSTYLGHVDPSATYWYLTGVPDLFALAAQDQGEVEMGHGGFRGAGRSVLGPTAAVSRLQATAIRACRCRS